jgi:hypothetical protein
MAKDCPWDSSTMTVVGYVDGATSPTPSGSDSAAVGLGVRDREGDRDRGVTVAGGDTLKDREGDGVLEGDGATERDEDDDKEDVAEEAVMVHWRPAAQVRQPVSPPL